MIFDRLFNRKPPQEQVVYEAIVAAARRPVFYTDMAVADTVDGRFDMIALHMFLVLDRLKGQGHADLRQRLTDAFFRDMDRSLREMGVGDVSVGKKVRKMAESFYGRVGAYERGLKEGEDSLQAALARNIYVDAQSDAVAIGLCKWVLASRVALAEQIDEDISQGKVAFP